MAHMELTEAEWQVMECLWAAAPRTGRAIIDALQHHADAAAAAGGQGRRQRGERGRREALPAAGGP